MLIDELQQRLWIRLRRFRHLRQHLPQRHGHRLAQGRVHRHERIHRLRLHQAFLERRPMLLFRGFRDVRNTGNFLRRHRLQVHHHLPLVLDPPQVHRPLHQLGRQLRERGNVLLRVLPHQVHQVRVPACHRPVAFRVRHIPDRRVVLRLHPFRVRQARIHVPL